ncbi:MAG: hypothetical protein HXY34_03925 [Candidatus Thorarchaeota archaeon]|nr:hypothetical protein [Candidatus Thorarchaeota archaeon]
MMADKDSDGVVPLHADSFFSVSVSGEIHERLCFEYSDPLGYYRRVTGDEGLFESEIRKLSANLQGFLNEERVEINGEEVRSIVRYADVFMKGDSNVVGIVYLIDFAGRFRETVNTIETWLEDEDAPYDFEIIWRFPHRTRVEAVETRLQYEVHRDMVVLWANTGDRVGGYERMEFTLPTGTLDTRDKMKMEES